MKPFDPTLDSAVVAFNLTNATSEVSLLRNLVSDEIGFCIGSWMGEREFSYQVPYGYSNDKLKNLLHRYGQEHIMIIRGGLAYIASASSNYYIDNLSEPAGKLVEVDYETVQGDYTYCLATNKYYVIEKLV